MALIKKMLHKLVVFLRAFKVFMTDMFFYLHNSAVSGNYVESKEKHRSRIIACYHVIEKGLTMPNRHLGFGKEVLKSLISLSLSYSEKYGTEDEQLLCALEIIKAYDVLHKTNKFLLDSELQTKIDDVLALHRVEPIKEFIFTNNDFFNNIDKPFDVFSKSRHSTRHFNGSVSTDSVKEAIKLAQYAPSACNMQPTRIHLVTNHEQCKQILDLQAGNRGFGQLIDKVIVLTVKISGCVKYSDRFTPFIDCGIYTMNLLYSLHFHKIGAIPLIWPNTNNNNHILRDMLCLSKDEIPSIVIGIGCVNEQNQCPASPRNGIDYVLTIH